MIICDNFLPNLYKEELKKIILGDFFPWYFNDFIISGNDNNKLFQFTHTFFNDGKITSDYFKTIEPMLYFAEEKLNLKTKSILRIKANLLTQQDSNIEESKHVDCELENYKSLLFYVNDSDGDTLFLDTQTKVSPKENRAVLFDSKLNHTSTAPSIFKRRVVLNFVVENS